MNQDEEFPSVSQQFDNLSKFVFDMVTDVTSGDFNVFANQETQTERLQICQMCEFYAAKQKRCRKCGCWMEHKVQFSASTCPIDKW